MMIHTIHTTLVHKRPNELTILVRSAASPDSNNKPILGFSVEVKYTGPDRDDQEPIDRIDAQPVGQQQQQRNEDQMFKKKPRNCSD